MKISKIETFPVSIPYAHDEVSYLIKRSGVSNVVVKITTDDGLVGWGESCMVADTAEVVAAVQAAEPFLLGRDPWDKEAIANDYFVFGGWQWQVGSGNFAFAGIDMALWDICGKACGQPLYKLFGGAVRDDVNYFFYLTWGDEEDLRRQCREGIEKGYTVFYFKVGVDFPKEEHLLEVIRDSVGPEAKIRIDANAAWSVPAAIQRIRQIDKKVGLDFVEAPTNPSPIENYLEVKNRTSVSICANEGLWSEADAIRVIQSRCVDHLGFSPYFVGSLRRWHCLCHMANLSGQLVHKHTHGEFGITAAALQHILLTLPNVADGNQQTAQFMADDVLKETIPIAHGPTWGKIDGPGIGVEVDEDKILMYNEAFRRDGDFKPYGDRFGDARQRRI